MEPICKAIPKASNESVIVTYDCTVKATKMAKYGLTQLEKITNLEINK